MKALRLYCHIWLCVFQNFTKWNWQTWSKFSFGYIWQWKGKVFYITFTMPVVSKIKLSLVFLLLFDPEASNLALLFIYYSFSPFTGVAMDPIWLWASRRLWPQRLHIGLYGSHLGLMVSGTCGFLQCRFIRPTPNPSTCCWVALPRVWVSNRKPSHHNQVVTPSRQR